MTGLYSNIPAAALCAAGLAAATENDYPIRPVSANRVELAPDNFWAPRVATNRAVTVWHDFQECEKTGRIANFEKAAGLKNGYFEGLRFNDSDVYKVIEGASYILAEGPDPKLDAYLDNLIGIIARAQQPDGYLYTARTVPNDPAKPVKGLGESRWHEQESHELYCAGHLYEAAVAHFNATGKRALLDIAIKNANLVTNTFGPAKLRVPPGHQEIELALVKLHRTTGDPNYLDLARFFLEERGHSHDGRKLWGSYFQDAVPVRDETEAVGHSVRAAYQYMAMADVAAATDDKQYVSVLEKLWDNVSEKKLYLTGGIGGGSGEGFSGEYDLPNLGTYNETCSSIANILWQQRMFQLTGESKYLDVLERCLFNSFLSGVGMSGDRFFYPNKLCSADGQQRSGWFACACCPPNVVRFIPQIEGLYYATAPDEVFVNLYGSGTASVPVGDTSVEIRQTGSYPWEGLIRIELKSSAPREFSCHLRLPGWLTRPLPSLLYRYTGDTTQLATVKINGRNVDYETTNGYAVLKRVWQSGDTVELALPMPVRTVLADEKVESCNGQLALMRGPLVYCAEGPDNGGSVHNFVVGGDVTFTPLARPDLLGGLTILKTEVKSAAWNESGGVATSPSTLSAIPYFAWAHRGRHPMRVWLPASVRAAWPSAAATLASTAKVSTSNANPWSNPAAINDQILPRNSNDREVPRFLWKDGGIRTDADVGKARAKDTSNAQWVQYDFPKITTISSVGVFWANDVHGRIALPRSARILVKRQDEWLPVSAEMPAPLPDRMNPCDFSPVETRAVRLEISPAGKKAAGILEWQIK